MKKVQFRPIGPTVVLTLLLALFASEAYALPFIKTKTDPVNGVSVEVSATEAITTDEVDTAINWAARDLESSQAENPSVKPEIGTAEADASGAPTVIAASSPDVRDAGLRSRLYEILRQHHRVIFTIGRGVGNLGVVTWGLMASGHVTLEQAVPVGLMAGGMSAGFMWFNKAYQRWLLRSKTQLGQLGRNTGVNVFYMAVTKFTSLLTGVPHESSFLLATETLLKAATLGTLAQGTWNLAFATNATVAERRNPEQTEHIWVMNGLKTFVLSVVSTGLSVASLMGVHLTDAAMYAMIGSGAIYYTWSVIKARRFEKQRLADLAKLESCATNLLE